jgi:hypothetical protein
VDLSGKTGCRPPRAWWPTPGGAPLFNRHLGGKEKPGRVLATTRQGVHSCPRGNSGVRRIAPHGSPRPPILATPLCRPRARKRCAAARSRSSWAIAPILAGGLWANMWVGREAAGPCNINARWKYAAIEAAPGRARLDSFFCSGLTGDGPAALHPRSRHEQPDRLAGASRTLLSKDTGRGASPPWP